MSVISLGTEVLRLSCLHHSPLEAHRHRNQYSHCHEKWKPENCSGSSFEGIIIVMKPVNSFLLLKRENENKSFIKIWISRKKRSCIHFFSPALQHEVKNSILLLCCMFYMKDLVLLCDGNNYILPEDSHMLSASTFFYGDDGYNNNNMQIFNIWRHGGRAPYTPERNDLNNPLMG